jgi:hypothetical protein
MLKKWIQLAIIVVLLWIPVRTAQAYVHDIPPDTLRVPAVISLLKEAPFYNSPDDPANQAEGIIAPQDGIQVLSGELTWAMGGSWWKIKTWLGPKWISVNSWDMDVAPPERLNLYEDTPMYASQDESLEPSAVLSPQEVHVTGAEKKWFLPDNKTGKSWIRIQTSWLGDQWVHLPVKRIGYIKPVDYYFYYAYQMLLDDPNYSGPYASMAGPIFNSLTNQTVHVTGEFVSVYDKSYQIETDNGPKIALERGRLVERTAEKITLKSDTPFYTIPGTATSFMRILHPQSLTAFEKFVDSSMYHVHTELGDGWVNLEDSEPTDMTKTDITIQVNGKHQLYRFPKQDFNISGANLEQVSVNPVAYWKDSDGFLWYQLRGEEDVVWFMLNPEKDEITNSSASLTSQLTFRNTVLDTVDVNGNVLTVKGQEVGYLKDGAPYLSLAYLTNRFQFTGIDPKEGSSSATLFHDPVGYSFRLTQGSLEAATLWEGQEAERITLHEAPIKEHDDMWIGAQDAEALFGVSVDWFKSGKSFYVFRDEFDVHLPQIQAPTTDTPFKMTQFLFHRLVGYYDATPVAIPQLEIKNSSIAEQKAFVNPIVKLGKIDYKTELMQESVTVPLQDGVNHLTLAVKVGHRILAQLQQDFTYRLSK